MAVGHKTFSLSRWPEAARWGACFVFAVAFHAAGAAALFARWSEDSDLVANAPVIMVDLAPVAVSPNITNDVPPGPPQPDAEPEPQKADREDRAVAGSASRAGRGDATAQAG